jgi:hypothetical protein
MTVKTSKAQPSSETHTHPGKSRKGIQGQPETHRCPDPDLSKPIKASQIKSKPGGHGAIATQDQGAPGHLLEVLREHYTPSITADQLVDLAIGDLKALGDAGWELVKPAIMHYWGNRLRSEDREKEHKAASMPRGTPGKNGRIQWKPGTRTLAREALECLLGTNIAVLDPDGRPVKKKADYLPPEGWYSGRDYKYHHAQGEIKTGDTYGDVGFTLESLKARHLVHALEKMDKRPS